jgi:hypothetical protein
MWGSLLNVVERCWRKAFHTLASNAGHGITLHDNLQIKVRRGAKGKPVIEQFTGDDLHRKSGRWMHKVQIVDREKDRYFKEVIDPETGEIVRRCEEPLSRHQGYRSAKKRR